MKNKVLIINYKTLENLGGIEKHIYTLAKTLLRLNVRIIWICGKGAPCAESYRDIMCGDKIERVYLRYSSLLWFDYKDIGLTTEDEVVVLSFTPLGLAKSFSIVSKNANVKITPLYVVPNTTGATYFVERNFNGFIKKWIHKQLAQIFQKWVDMDLIRFFNYEHIAPLISNYSLRIENIESKIKSNVEYYPDLDVSLLIQRSARTEFNIVTIGRFDFPHKGYILGLIRAYGRLKKRYPHIKLRIIGFGPQKDEVEKEINKLSELERKDIILLGEVAPKDIPSVLKDCHLNISVAGAVGDGVKCGVLSIPARNYCGYDSECEVYGFLPESFNMLSSTEPGILVDRFIEQVIEMSDSKYIEIVKKSHLKYKTVTDLNVNPFYYFKTRVYEKTIRMSKRDILFLKLVNFLKNIIIVKNEVKNLLTQ